MRSARSAVLGTLLTVMISLVSPAAHASTGSGVIVHTSALFTAYVGTAEDLGWFVMAYRQPDNETTRIYAYDTAAKAGLAMHDDVELDASALTIEWNSSTQNWSVSLKADLPSIGSIDLRLVSADGLGASGGTCLGKVNYHLRSPSGSLGQWGNIYGSIDGHDLLPGSDCMLWGSDAYGAFSAPPYGDDISD